MGARVVHRYILESINDPRLVVYAVWGPFKERETEADARWAAAFLPDPRTTHFWTEAVAAGEVFRRPLADLGLSDHSAWDSWLLYPAGVRWEETPPKPAHFMHREIAGRSLNGRRLAEAVRALLAAAPPHSSSARGSPGPGGPAPP